MLWIIHGSLSLGWGWFFKYLIETKTIRLEIQCITVLRDILTHMIRDGRSHGTQTVLSFHEVTYSKYNETLETFHTLCNNSTIILFFVCEKSNCRYVTFQCTRLYSVSERNEAMWTVENISNWEELRNHCLNFDFIAYSSKIWYDSSLMALGYSL
jgi:hypothetical protein